MQYVYMYVFACLSQVLVLNTSTVPGTCKHISQYSSSWELMVALVHILYENRNRVVQLLYM